MILKVALPNGRVKLYKGHIETDPVGYRVLVPLKEGATTGIVVGVREGEEGDLQEAEFPDREKLIEPYHIELVRELAEYYFTIPYRLLFKLLPAQFVWRKRVYVRVDRKRAVALDALSKSLVDYLLNRGKVRLSSLSNKFPEALVRSLHRKGILKLEEEWDIPKVSSRVFTLKLPLEEALRRVRSEERRRLILMVYTSMGMGEEEIKQRGFRLSLATELVRRGIFEESDEYTYETRRVSALRSYKRRTFLDLSNNQLAYGELSFLMDRILSLSELNLSKGYSTLILFPELKSLLYVKEQFEQELGDRVVALHSGVGSKELFRLWFGVRKNPTVILGSFMASLIPMKSPVNVIVFDESTKSVKLHHTFGLDIRNLAYLLARKQKAEPLFLSPVPSSHTYYLSLKKNLGIKGRIEDRETRVFKREPREILTLPLVEFLSENKEREILFLARKRGYSYMFCDRCGFIVECPSCSSLMTYSMFRELLYCSKCGYKHGSVACPKCEGKLRSVGFGIERVIKVVEENFGLRENFFFSNTPDFKDSKEVVIVVSADNILSVPSYQADEEFFQYIFRAYMNAREKFILQTVFPEHRAVRALKSLDPESFLREELLFREREKLPPFYRLIRLVSTRRIDALLEERIPAQIHGIFREGRWHYLLRLERGNREAVKRIAEFLSENRGILELVPE